MLSRSDRNELVQTLENTKNIIQIIAKTLMLKKVPAVISSLQQVRLSCEQSLSKEHAQFYTDTLLSLENILQGFDKEKMTVKERIESLGLMGDIISEVENQFFKETEIKKEIWFLPYKASMWDSLESIWRAAAEDTEHCCACVMPIPYADRNPDGSAAGWHCERGEFPTDVPTVKWEDVDLGAVHPDVIFIHNPYDGCNRVTSVDSKYYSHELKGCTDKLVYVPYFVLAEPDWIKDETLSDEQKKKYKDDISGFICTPGVINADEVYVQSENMRQVYIEVLTEETNHKEKEYWEKRIHGFGSPKLDMVKKKNTEYKVPEKWQKLIKKKKIIFYNISIAATLHTADNLCDKMRYVFSVFKNRNDVVLWWRPHPLLEATLQSMRSEIIKEYLELKKRYIEENWGIYDDSAELDRAVVCTDAYYGDCSSVVELYRETGKPIMIQDNGL